MSDMEAQTQSSNDAIVAMQQQSRGNEVENINQNQSQTLSNILDTQHAEQNAASTAIVSEKYP